MGVYKDRLLKDTLAGYAIKVMEIIENMEALPLDVLLSNYIPHALEEVKGALETFKTLDGELTRIIGSIEG